MSGDSTELSLMDAHTQAVLVARGDITAAELTNHALTCVEKLNPIINAVSHTAPDLARRRAGAPRGVGERYGVPYLLKDSLPYIGMPSRCGSRVLAHVGNDTRHYEYADRLDAAGLIPIGKSTAPEFSLLPTTESVLYGATRNPWDLTRSAGGSSGGAAAAVASGMVALAHAADGGGSIRIPASCCGVVGLKPSRGGTVRAREFHLLEDVLVGDGLLARSVRDVAWSARLVRPAGFTPRVKTHPLDIAVCLRDMTGALPHADVTKVIEQTAALCAQLGHRVTYIDHLPAAATAACGAFRTLWHFLARDGVEHAQRKMPGTDLSVLFEPWALGLAAAAARRDAVELAGAYAVMGEAARAISVFYQTYDVLLSPVVNDVPPPLGYLAGTRDFDDLIEDMFAYIGYTPLQNIAGHPSISLPLFTSSAGLPVGSMLSADWGGDETLLALAAELETAAPWRARLPAVHATRIS